MSEGFIWVLDERERAAWWGEMCTHGYGGDSALMGAADGKLRVKSSVTDADQPVPGGGSGGGERAAPDESQVRHGVRVFQRRPPLCDTLSPDGADGETRTARSSSRPLSDLAALLGRSRGRGAHLSDLVGKGVFRAWDDPGFFDRVFVKDVQHDGHLHPVVRGQLCPCCRARRSRLGRPDRTLSRRALPRADRCIGSRVAATAGPACRCLSSVGSMAS